MAPVAVLVVEDDGGTRRALVEMLGSWGYTAAEAVDGRDALDYLDRAPHPRLILLDLAMAGMNGDVFLLLKQADPRLADIPVVVYTGIERESPLDGVTEYVRKGASTDVLRRSIERIIGAPARPTFLH